MKEKLTSLIACILFISCHYFSLAQPFTVGLNTTQRIIQDDLFGFNGTNTIDQFQSWEEIGNDPSGHWGGMNPFCQFNLGHIRYPGGTVGNYWDFRKGWFLQPNQLPSGMTLPSNYDPENPFALQDQLEYFKISSDIINSSPVFQVNALTSDFYYQAGMLYRAKELGFPVKYQELGNEFYLEDKNYYIKYPSVHQYAEEANKWAGLIKLHPGFSNIKCAALSAFSYGQNDYGRRKLWNKCLLDEMKEFENNGTLNIDAFTIHQYIGSGVTGTGSGVMTLAQVQSMLSEPFISLAGLQNNEFSLVDQYFGNTKEIWMTEFNMTDRNSGFSTHSTWAHGLFVASMALGYLEEPNVAKVTMHTSLGSGVWSAFFSNDQGLLNWNDFTPPPNCQNLTVTGERSAAGSAMQLIVEAIKHAGTAHQLTFSGGTIPLINGNGTHEALYGWKFTSDFGEKVIILNLHEDPWDLTGISSNNFFTGNPSSVNWLTLHMNNSSGDHVNNAPNANPVDLISATNDCELYFETNPSLNTSTTLTLKAHSITLLSYDYPSQLRAYATEQVICDNSTTSIKVYGYSGALSANVISGPGSVSSNGPTCPDVFTFTPATVSIQTASVIEIDDGISTVQITITVNPSPLLTVNQLTGTSNFCPASSPTFDFDAVLTNLNPNPDVHYIWTPTQFLITPNDQTTATFKPDTTFDVIVYATDGTCWVSNSDAPIIIASDKPEFTFENDVLDCDDAGNTVDLSVEGMPIGNNYTYLWSYNSLTTSDITVPVTSGATTYTVTVTANPQQANECASVAEVTVNGVSCCTGTNNPDVYMVPHFANHFSTSVQLLSAVASVCGTCVNGNTISNFTGIIYINGRFRITSDLLLDNCTVRLGEKAEIIVRPNRTLTFEACTIEKCGSNLWNHIIADDESATIIINDPASNDYSYISGAETAVQLENLAQFGIWHAAFDDNLTHIRFKDFYGDITQNYNFTSGNQQNYIVGNTFNGTNLSPDNSIDIQYATSLEIGFGGTVYENTFSNSINGINAINASLWLRNNHFHDIPRADVLLIGDDECNDRTLEAGNGLNGGANLFETSGNGIITVGEVNLKVHWNRNNNNGFSGITNESIAIFNNYTKKIEITDNEISQFNIGVLGFDIGRDITLDISTNHFFDPSVVTGSNYEGAAVTIQNPLHYKSNAPKNITFNTIDDARIGIHYMNLDGINASDNSINFNLTSPPSDPYTGIWSERNTGCNIMRNTITQNTYNAGYADLLKGIDLTRSFKTYLGCNHVNNMGWGMYFQDDCDGAQLHINNMHNYDIGIQCNNAKVPQQGSPGISWLNSWKCDDATANQFNFRVAGTTQSGAINWFHAGAVTYLNPGSPEPGDPAAVNPIGGTTGIVYDPCRLGDPDRSNGQSRDELFGAVVGDSLRFEDYENEQTYNAKQNAYITFKSDTALLIANSPADEDFQSFYSEMQESNIGFFEEVNDNIIVSDTSIADSVNTAIADTNWIEYNKKIVNDLYINKYLKHIPFTAADTSVLQNIALQHAVTGGDAVFMARAMLRIEVHEQPLPLRKQKDTVQKTGNSNITLYPNPASNKVHLSGGSGKVLAKIYDHTGRLVLEQTVTNTINISSLETGVYSIKIFEHDEMIYYDRLVKLK